MQANRNVVTRVQASGLTLLASGIGRRRIDGVRGRRAVEVAQDVNEPVVLGTGDVRNGATTSLGIMDRRTFGIRRGAYEEIEASLGTLAL